MIRILPFDDDRVVALHVDGKTTAEDLPPVLSTIEKKLAVHDRLRIYLELHDFGGLSADALLGDLKAALKHWNRFEREAIVTDTAWAQKVASAAGRLVPGLDIRSFAFNERDAARSWIRDA